VSSEYLDKLRELERAVLNSPAGITPTVRRQILERARNLAARRPAQHLLDSWIETLTDAVVTNPVAADVDSYVRQGKTEGQVFEVVTVAAVGVALARADMTLPALRKSR
jgi:hypothetical protein